MSASNRPKTLSIKEKVAIIAEIESLGGKQSTVAAKYNIHKTTLSSIWRNRERLKSSLYAKPKRLRICTAKYEPLEMALLDFYNDAKSRNIPVSPKLLRQKALQLSKELNIENFTDSNGWYYGFKERYGINARKQKKECNKNNSDDSTIKIDNGQDEANLLNSIDFVSTAAGFEATHTENNNNNGFDQIINHSERQMIDCDTNVNYFLDTNLAENYTLRENNPNSPSPSSPLAAQSFSPQNSDTNNDDDQVEVVEDDHRNITDQNMREAIETLFYGFTQKSQIPDSVFQSLNFMTTLVNNK